MRIDRGAKIAVANLDPDDIGDDRKTGVKQDQPSVRWGSAKRAVRNGGAQSTAKAAVTASDKIYFSLTDSTAQAASAKKRTWAERGPAKRP